MKTIIATALSAIFLSNCASLSSASRNAISHLRPTDGNTVTGTVSFVQTGAQLVVDAQIENLTPGLHGFHIHEKGDCSAPDASSAGGHFNPDAKTHGAPSHEAHHAGDFGNLNADASGKAILKLVIATNQVTLAKDLPHSIIGKGLIIHAAADDYQTQPTGNSGKRVACGIISLK